MIAKIWKYELSKDTKGGAAQQNVAYDIALGSSCYILGVSPAASSLEAFELAQRVGDYIGAPDVDPERILQRYSSGLVSTEPVGQANELAVHAAAAGLARLYHLVYSYKVDDEPDAEMLKLHREIFLRVLNADGCASVGADHGDEPNPHHHEAVVAMDPLTGQGISFGQGWYIEACHIALAICEYRSELEPEPNRRYVADERGVYHMLSGLRIADADGHMVKDDDGAVSRNAIVGMHKQHDKIMSGNAPPDPSLAGQPWTIGRAVELIAAPRMQTASTWEELHRNLATIGIRYTILSNTARLELQGHGNDEADRSAFIDDHIRAGAAYANGALGKLSRRLGFFQPPPDDLMVRPFVMPRYDPPVDDAKVERAEKKALEQELRPQAEELRQTLQDESAQDRADLQKLKLADLYSDAQTIIAGPRREELAVVERLMIDIGVKRRRVSKKASAKPKPIETPFFDESNALALLWRGHRARKKERLADLRRTEARRAELKKLYTTIERYGVIGYYRGKALAFVEHANTVMVHADDRQTKIDALKLAEAKFGKVRIFGDTAWIQDCAKLAAEMGIELHRSQQHIGEAHLKALALKPKTRLIHPPDPELSAKPIAAASPPRANTANAPRQPVRIDAKLQESVRREERQRSERINRILKRFNDLELINDVADERARGAKIRLPNSDAAHALLDKMDRDRLQLPSSRFDHEGVRYLDDKALNEALGEKHGQDVLRPDIQARLQAIDLLQRVRWRWIGDAMKVGRISVQNDEIKVARKDDNWAINFYRQQSNDPNFLHYLRMDGETKNEDHKVDLKWLDTPPEITVWRRERSANNPNAAVVGALADEFYLRMSRSPERFKKVLTKLQPTPMQAYLEGKALQESASRFGMEYFKVTPHKPGSGRRRRPPGVQLPTGKSLK
ncbi:LPD7 domain-containing protein [Novosphingopyxis sp.]|uniref:LPD7 domain-containing protein n=1 Tax=Novosphingopyxis sp. TaxID=2709690 RepID=UPI003B5B8FE5